MGSTLSGIVKYLKVESDSGPIEKRVGPVTTVVEDLRDGEQPVAVLIRTLRIY